MPLPHASAKPPSRHKFGKLLLVVNGAAAVLLAAIFLFDRSAGSTRTSGPVPLLFLHDHGRPALERAEGMVLIPAGSFLMGGPGPDGSDARPRHRVTLPSFWLDETPVTNAQFAEFVDATGYTTEAERRGQSLVFDIDLRQWRTVPGADWRHPHGPNSSIAGRESWPVVQVSWYDAIGYARWAGKRLPTEAEYEYAARGGLADGDYPWGREPVTDGHHRANFWQGRFPHFDLARDGYPSIAPVRAFPANRYGLADMLGNVYAWTADWYDTEYYGRSPRENPTGPESGQQKVQRGGSWLSAENHEPPAVWFRRPADPTASSNHTGFRCARDSE